MEDPNIVRGTSDQLPRVSQLCRLVCEKCGATAKYDVGTIFLARAEEEKSGQKPYSFSNYFRCVRCGSAGPWDIAERGLKPKLLLRALRPKTGRVFVGQFQTFDGECVQSPALAEEHLLTLLKKDPRNAFLHTRLGNLFRGCGFQDRAGEWYLRALNLDQGDVEARYHMFCFTMDAAQFPQATAHALLLAQYLLAGRETNNDELTRGLALSFVSKMRSASGDLGQDFRARLARPSAAPQERFLRGLLEAEGEENAIIEDAADRLLGGIPDPEAAAPGQGQTDPDSQEPVLTPSLKKAVEAGALDVSRLAVALLMDDNKRIHLPDKHSIRISDGQKIVPWQVASLGELFRGNRAAPADIEEYPPQYAPYFFRIERQLLTLCEAMGDRTDQELEEVYSELRRRPDGRSLGLTHDFVWQTCALLLGSHPLSEAEFNGMLGALIRSTRRWALKPVSRNYVAYLRRTLD